MEADPGRGAALSIALCAGKVRAGDPDRFLSAMTAPPEARGALFTLYAFNLEIARAPWVSREPMIAGMRLQFWRDVLEEAAAGKPPRAHEVAGPLAELMRARRLPPEPLRRMIDARRRDSEREAFADESALVGHMEATSAELMDLAVRVSGAESGEAVRNVGYASGIANWFCAVPALQAAGRKPLVDGGPKAVRALADGALDRLASARTVRFARAALPALRAAWLAPAILKAARADPARVAAGELRPSEFRRRASLLARTWAGRW